MALSLKKKSQPAAKNTDDRIDRLAELIEWDDAHKKDPRTKELEALKKELVAEYSATLRNDQTCQMAGVTATILFDKPGDVRSIIDLKALHKEVGDEVFYAKASFPMKAVDDYLTLEQKERLVKTEPTGPRKFKGITRNT